MKISCASSMLLISVMSVMLMISCDNKELCYDHSHVVELEVNFDWSAAPDANPESMSMYLFPVGGGETLRYEFSGNKGGKIRLSPGVYDIICLNSDTRNIQHAETHSFSTFEIYTQEAEMMETLSSVFGFRSENIPRSESAADERVVSQSEQLWVSSLTEVEIGSTSTSTLTRQSSSITIGLSPFVEIYHVRITNIKNISGLLGMGASLSGLAGGAFPSSRKHSERQVTVPFEVSYDINTATANGNIAIFGHCEDYNREHHLMIYAIMSDGNKYYYDIDVKDKIHQSEKHQNQITIEIDGLELPEVVGGASGGLTPTLEDWDTVNVNLNM